jgi:FKBP-type peptidyl-prolyl cis-trans isomerase FkpA
MKHIIFFLLIGITLASCNKDQRSEDEIINDYIVENGLEGDFTESGLFISIENPGGGQQPTLDDRVTVHYQGLYAADSEEFDSSLGGNPITFNLNGLIKGWQEGIPYFGIGDKGWLVMPAKLAYGSFPPSGIRVNAPMAFYIELIDIE